MGRAEEGSHAGQAAVASCHGSALVVAMASFASHQCLAPRHSAHSSCPVKLLGPPLQQDAYNRFILKPSCTVDKAWLKKPHHSNDSTLTSLFQGYGEIYMRHEGCLFSEVTSLRISTAGSGRRRQFKTHKSNKRILTVYKLQKWPWNTDKAPSRHCNKELCPVRPKPWFL